MTGQPLAGIEGARALQAMMRLGNAGASFDRGRVDRAVRTSAGRRKILLGLRRALERAAAPDGRFARPARPRGRRPRRPLLAARASGPPGRPADTPRPGPAGGR